MALTAHMVTIDGADPAKLSSFWTAALDYIVVQDLGPGYYLILAPTSADAAPRRGLPRRGLPRVGLPRVPEPRVGKNRVHIDFSGPGPLPQLIDRLVSLGATALDRQEVPGFVWQVLADPEGNEFCVSAEG